MIGMFGLPAQETLNESSCSRRWNRWLAGRFDDIKDNSKNTLPIDFLMMGELYQNNHHRRPNNMNFAVRWFEIDLGYIATSFLKKLKVIY